MNPDPLTLRELIWMAEAKRRDEWDRLSVLIAVTINVTRTRKSDMVSPAQFNPFLFGARHRKISNVRELAGMMGIEHG